MVDEIVDNLGLLNFHNFQDTAKSIQTDRKGGEYNCALYNKFKLYHFISSNLCWKTADCNMFLKW